MKKLGVIVLLVLFVVGPVKANEVGYWFTWPAFTGESLTYTVWHSNVALADSTWVATVVDDGTSDYAVSLTLTGGEVYDVSVRGVDPQGVSDSCTKRVDVPEVQAHGCDCALVP